MDEFTFLKKFSILESHLRSKFPEFERRPFPELLSYLKRKKLLPLGILFDLFWIWDVRCSIFGKSLKKPKIPAEMQLIFKELGKYFKLKYV